MRITVLLAISGFVASYEAPLLSTPGQNTTPDIYVVELREDCTLEQHFKAINVSKTEPYFDKSPYHQEIHAYAGYFPPLELLRIRSSRCVLRISSEWRLEPPETYLKGAESHRLLKPQTAVKSRRSLQWYTYIRRLSASRVLWNLRMVAVQGKIDLDGAEQGPHEGFVTSIPMSSVAGQGVDVYLIDRGFAAQTKWNVFGDRISEFVPISKYDQPREEEDELHGAQVASIIASDFFGVARYSNLRTITVPYAHHIALAFHKIAREHKRKQGDPNYKGAIINMSIDQQMRRNVLLAKSARMVDESGILLVVGAGNQGTLPTEQNSCRLPGAFCIGSVNRTYGKSGHSNFGPSVNLWAPGKYVIAPCFTRPNKLCEIHGTSFAAPHVSGTAAVILAQAVDVFPDMKFNTFHLKNLLMGNAQWGILDGIGPSRNVLVNTGIRSPSREPTLPFALTKSEDVIAHELRREPRADHPEGFVHCFTPRSPQVITLRTAEQLWLRLRWDASHDMVYDKGGASINVVPCLKDACVKIWAPNVKGGKPYWVEMDSVANLVSKILTTCKRESLTLGKALTGGFATMGGELNPTIFLGRGKFG